MSWRDLPAPGRPYAEVIGDPIAHSKSPVIHGHWLAALGLDADYRTAHVPQGELAAYLEARAQDTDWRGCNVTIPHKVEALSLATRADALAGTVGAANLLVNSGKGETAAFNTDVPGFLEGLPEELPAQAVVIGAGGAARAVLAALTALGGIEVVLVNRDQAKARALAKEFDAVTDVRTLEAGFRGDEAGLLVNASALGMTGKEPLEIDLSFLPQGAVVYDLVYAPLETGLLAEARRCGLVAIDGLAMLIGQAATAFTLLFGTEPPRGDDAALRRTLTA